MPDSLKVQIEQALMPLIGLKLSIARRAADMRNFQFGKIRPHSKGGTVGDYALHIQGAWRLENDSEIVTGSGDLWEWKYNDHQPHPWTYEKGGNLQDALIGNLLKGYDLTTRSEINVTDQLVVERVEGTLYGDATLHLSGGYRLRLFPISRFKEAWRFFEPGADESHFVVGDDEEDRGFTPVTVAGYLERAEHCYATGDTKRAIAACTEAIQLEPQNSAAYLKRAYYRDNPKANDDYAGAIADYTEAIRLDPQNPDSYLGRAMIYEYNKEDYEAAIRDFTEALRLKPYAAGYLSRGFCHSVLSQNEAAIADFTHAIALEPSVDGYVRRARSRYELEDLGGALADCDAAVALDPHSSFAYYWRGNIHDEMGHSDSGISDLTRAIEIRSNYDEALHLRAWVRYQKGEYDTALSDANVAIHLDATEWTYFHTRGAIYAAKNDIVHAICNFQSALDLDVDDSNYAQEMIDYITQWVKTPDKL